MKARPIVMDAILKGARTAQDVWQVTMLCPGTVKSCLSDLKADGWIKVTTVGPNGVYSYAPTERGRHAYEDLPVDGIEEDDDGPVRVAPGDLVEKAIARRTELEVAWAGQTNGARVVSV